MWVVPEMGAHGTFRSTDCREGSGGRKSWRGGSGQAGLCHLCQGGWPWLWALPRATEGECSHPPCLHFRKMTLAIEQKTDCTKGMGRWQHQRQWGAAGWVGCPISHTTAGYKVCLINTLKPFSFLSFFITAN